MKKKIRKTHWLVKYTIIFCITCLLVYSLQIYYGKSFLYSVVDLSGDSLVQHFNSLVYYGDWLRSILNNIFVQHTFSIPEFDLSVGLGGDIITTLNFYVLGDPLNLLAAFVPASSTEFLYHVLVIVRLYLAGITFFLYCRYHSYKSDWILPGVLIYVFSFYSIAISILHPFFLNPLIYFPLILLGVDKILKESKPMLFILSCALSAASNFYFFYMMTILMVIYCAIRYVQYHLKEIKFLPLLKEIGRFALYYIIAIMISAPLFLPSVAAVLGSSRAGGGKNVPLVYEMIYYIKLPISFFNACADHYSYLGYGAIGALAVILLFTKTKWKEKIGFKIAFLLGTIFLLIPFFGHMLNGFGYVTNRWVWGYCFVVSLIVVEMFRDIVNLPRAGRWITAGMAVLFAAPTFYFRSEGRKEKQLFAVVTILIFFAVLSLIILLCRYLKNGATVYLLMTVAFIFFNAFGFYSPHSGDYLKYHGNFGEAWQDINSGPLSVLEGMENHKLKDVRIDTSNLYFGGVRANAAMIYNVNSTSFYYSMINESVNAFFHDDMWLPMPYENRYVDLDSSTMLSALLGVKYTIIRSGDEAYLPYGYERMVQEKNGYALFETDVTLPMAFWYDSAMSEREYGLLYPLQKQQAMLQTAVIQENDWEVSNVNLKVATTKDLEIENITLEYEIEGGTGIKVEGNRIEVEQAGAFLTLKTDSAEHAERYFAFENLWYEGKKKSQITITDGIKSKDFEIKSNMDEAYADIHNFLCNLGYSGQQEEYYKIFFGEPGVYTYDSMEIINQPLEKMENWIDARRKNEVDYSFDEDSVLLHVNSNEDGLVYVSIPYSSGWKACVDGEEAKILKTNNFGIGLAIGKGEHTIELSYHTPYMHFGIILMIVGIVCCAVLNVLRVKSERSND